MFIFFAIGLLCNNLNKIAFAEDSSLTEETATIKVTKGDSVKYYSTFSDAINNADKGSTIKILKNTDLCNFNNKNITLDINGKTLSGESTLYYDQVIFMDSLNSGSITGSVNSYFSTITINSCKFTNSFLSTTGTNFTMNDGYINTLYAVNDSINITGGTLNSLYLYTQGKVHLSGGTINSFKLMENETFAILNTNYCYKNVDGGKLVKIADMTNSTKVTIVPCEHSSFKNGLCEYCNYQCPHESFDSNGVCKKCDYQCPHNSKDENSKCIYCNKTFTTEELFLDLQKDIETAENNLESAISQKEEFETINEKINTLNKAIENAKNACNSYTDEQYNTIKNELIDLINAKADTETLNNKIDELNQAIENAKLACNNYADEKDTALKSDLESKILESKITLQNAIDELASRLTVAENKIETNTNQINNLKIAFIITIIAFIILMGSGFTILYVVIKKKQISK